MRYTGVRSARRGDVSNRVVAEEAAILSDTHNAPASTVVPVPPDSPPKGSAPFVAGGYSKQTYVFWFVALLVLIYLLSTRSVTQSMQLRYLLPSSSASRQEELKELVPGHATDDEDLDLDTVDRILSTSDKFDSLRDALKRYTELARRVEASFEAIERAKEDQITDAVLVELDDLILKTSALDTEITQGFVSFTLSLQQDTTTPPILVNALRERWTIFRRTSTAVASLMNRMKMLEIENNQVNIVPNDGDPIPETPDKRDNNENKKSPQNSDGEGEADQELADPFAEPDNSQKDQKKEKDSSLGSATFTDKRIAVEESVEYSVFMSRHDPVWKFRIRDGSGMPPSFDPIDDPRAPYPWYNGTILGNGNIGTVVHLERDTNNIAFDLGRVDVWDRRTRKSHGTAHNILFDKSRLPIGYLRMKTEGFLVEAEWRLNLHRAEINGRVRTTEGVFVWRAFVHSEMPVFIIECTGIVEENPVFAFQPRAAISSRPMDSKTLVRNPKVFRRETDDGITVLTQSLLAGGNHATAYKLVLKSKEIPESDRGLYVTIANDWPRGTSAETACETLRSAMRLGSAQLTNSHRKWWDSYYKQSLISIPTTRLESFYYNQLYKMASAVRGDGVPLDLMGPWVQRTRWTIYWMNMNIQLAYWPVYKSNRLQLGESLLNWAWDNRENIALNLPAKYRKDSYGVPIACPYDLRCFRMLAQEDKPNTLGNFPWICHNLYMQARYSGNDTQLRTKVFPLLKGAINLYLHFLEEDKATNTLHLPPTMSPEYPYPDEKNVGRDANYDNALLRWGCKALLETSQRLQLNDPLGKRWADVLKRLAQPPANPEQGLQVSETVKFELEHRHFSHMLGIYPLHTFNYGVSKEQNSLIERSLDHWSHLSCPVESKCQFGYTRVGKAIFSALANRPQAALGNLTELVTSGLIHPSTMYTEAGFSPVIETPLAAAAAVHELLVQCWDDGIVRVFPAVADAWNDVLFHRMTVIGGIEVSAERKQGKTQWIMLYRPANPDGLTSVAGDTVQVLMDISGPLYGLFEVDTTSDRAKSIEITTIGEDTKPIYIESKTKQLVTINNFQQDTRVLLRSKDEAAANGIGIDQMNSITIDAGYGNPDEYNSWGLH